MSEAFPITQDTRERFYQAAAGQASFAVPFPFQRSDDLRVTRILAGYSEEVPAALDIDYSVTGAGDPAGGMITFGVGQIGGTVVHIVGLANPARVAGITRGGRFNADAIDAEFDRVAIRGMELRRDLEAAMAAVDGIVNLATPTIWKATETYAAERAVQHAGAFWYALQPSMNKVPGAEPAYWLRYFSPGAVLTSDQVYSKVQTDALLDALDVAKQNVSPFLLFANANAVLTAGFRTTAVNDGNKAAGTYKPSVLGGNFRYITLTGSITLDAPDFEGAAGSMFVDVIMGAGAGTITFAGLTKPPDGLITNTNGYRYSLFFWKGGAGTFCTIFEGQ